MLFWPQNEGKNTAFQGLFRQAARGEKTLRCGQKVPFSGNQRFVVVSRPPLPAACSPSDGDYLVPVDVRAAFLSGLEAEEAQPLQYRLAKDAEPNQKDAELVQVFHLYFPLSGSLLDGAEHHITTLLVVPVALDQQVAVQLVHGLQEGLLFPLVQLAADQAILLGALQAPGCARPKAPQLFPRQHPQRLLVLAVQLTYTFLVKHFGNSARRPITLNCLTKISIRALLDGSLSIGGL